MLSVALIQTFTRFRALPGMLPFGVRTFLGYGVPAAIRLTWFSFCGHILYAISIGNVLYPPDKLPLVTGGNQDALVPILTGIANLMYPDIIKQKRRGQWAKSILLGSYGKSSNPQSG